MLCICVDATIKHIIKLDMDKHINQILAFRDARDWKQFHALKNLAISLVLEATEVLELFLWTKDNNLPEEKKEHLAEELADVYFNLLLLSHDAGIDLRKAFEKKMDQNVAKYPVEKSKGNSKKYTVL